MNSIKNCIVAFFIAANAISSVTRAAEWQLEDVYLNGESGWTIDALSGSNNSVHVNFYDGSGYRLMSRTPSGEWQLTADNDSSAVAAFDRNGVPHGLFRDLEGIDFGEWNQPPNTSRIWTGRSSSPAELHFDQNNLGHAIFADTPQQQLIHLEQSPDGNWLSQTVATNEEFRFASVSALIDFDQDEDLHVMWEENLERISYAREEAGSYSVRDITIPDEGDVFLHSMEVDSQERLHLVYETFSAQSDVKYGIFDDGTWQTEIIGGLDGFGAGRTKIVLDQGEVPHVFTFDGVFRGPDVLKHGQKNGDGNWEFNRIDALPERGQLSGPEEISAIINGSGMHVFYSQDDKNIRYAFKPIDLPGDVNSDGVLDAQDIDAITAAVAAGTYKSEFDLNADNAVDQMDRGIWVRESKNTYFGDANLDGEFNSRDFVFVFTTGEYEDNLAGNSSWATGDWNGDGDFTTRDFVAAFQDGGYEEGPRAAQSVPEPNCLAAFACLLLPLLRSRRVASQY